MESKLTFHKYRKLIKSLHFAFVQIYRKCLVEMVVFNCFFYCFVTLYIILWRPDRYTPNALFEVGFGKELWWLHNDVFMFFQWLCYSSYSKNEDILRWYALYEIYIICSSTECIRVWWLEMSFNFSVPFGPRENVSVFGDVRKTQKIIEEIMQMYKKNVSWKLFGWYITILQMHKW